MYRAFKEEEWRSGQEQKREYPSLCTESAWDRTKYECDNRCGLVRTQSCNHTLLQEKKQLFHRPGEEDFRIIRAKFKSVPRLISALQVEKMIRKELCQEFLVNFTGSEHTETIVNDINVVWDLVDVFPEDVAGIPQDRQMKFTIDLVLGMAPVSKVPYRMAPKELQELKLQLEELLEKGW